MTAAPICAIAEMLRQAANFEANAESRPELADFYRDIAATYRAAVERGDVAAIRDFAEKRAHWHESDAATAAARAAAWRAEAARYTQKEPA